MKLPEWLILQIPERDYPTMMRGTIRRFIECYNANDPFRRDVYRSYLKYRGVPEGEITMMGASSASFIFLVYHKSHINPIGAEIKSISMGDVNYQSKFISVPKRIRDSRLTTDSIAYMAHASISTERLRTE